MSNDDKINWAILIVFLLVMAYLVPARLRENADAEFGADLRQSVEQLRK